MKLHIILDRNGVPIRVFKSKRKAKAWLSTPLRFSVTEFVAKIRTGEGTPRRTVMWTAREFLQS